MISRDLLGQVERLLRPLRVRLANMVARATVELVRDASKMQRIQVTVQEGQTVDDVERFQPYGFSSVPLAGAEGVVVHPGGDGGHAIAVVVDDRRYRPTGKPGGHVCIYHRTGAIVEFSEEGDIVATPAAGRHALLGGASASDPPALSSELADLKIRIANWTPVPNDGGASLKTAVFSGWSVPGATKVKVE